MSQNNLLAALCQAAQELSDLVGVTVVIEAAVWSSPDPNGQFPPEWTAHWAGHGDFDAATLEEAVDAVRAAYQAYQKRRQAIELAATG